MYPDIEGKLTSKLSTSTNDFAAVYKQALTDQNLNYLEGYLTIYKEAAHILNENLELKSVSFISFINKLRNRITQNKTDISARLNEPVVCNRNIINLNGMKIKENKKRVYEHGEDPNKITFEEEKLSFENNENNLLNPFLPHNYKKLKDF